MKTMASPISNIKRLTCCVNRRIFKNTSKNQFNPTHRLLDSIQEENNTGALDNKDGESLNI